ncbi:MAG: hypothetical protein ABIO35_12595, partial [Nitrobacter sp.]
MADDRQDDVSQEGSPQKLLPPTDIETTGISAAADDAGSGDAAEAADDQQSISEQPVASPRTPSRTSAAVIGAITGAIAAGLVVGAAWLAGWAPSSSELQVTTAEFGALSNR